MEGLGQRPVIGGRCRGSRDNLLTSRNLRTATGTHCKITVHSASVNTAGTLNLNLNPENAGQTPTLDVLTRV